jgi:hypothetical protein
MPENYILIERTELNASAASVTFANIPQTGYTDLKVVISARNSRTSFIAEDYGVFFNGDTTVGNYSARQLIADGSAASSRSGYNYGVLVDGNTATANTFNNAEVYIPNYTSSTAKSCSVDAVTENNATAAYMAITARLWTGTSAITSVSIDKGDSGENNSFLAGSTFSLYGIAAVGTTPAIAPKASGGNIIDYDGTYWIHTFTSSGTFTPQAALSCDYLVIAGGGGGGASYGGGGGAGGYRAGSGLGVLPLTNYPITVGAGAAGMPATQVPQNGSDSIFSTITATGGGGGGAGNPQQLSVGPTNGGSGGGVGGFNPSTNSTNTPIGTGSTGQGNNGGLSSGNGWKGGGGGGGAGAVGANGSNNGSIALAGNGGAGLSSSITGTAVTRAGGGGAGAGFNGTEGTAGTGGAGGGGNGSNTTNGSAGTVNTGGGGGGGDQNDFGGAGGSGIVIIRYPAA